MNKEIDIRLSLEAWADNGNLDRVHIPAIAREIAALSRPIDNAGEAKPVAWAYEYRDSHEGAPVQWNPIETAPKTGEEFIARTGPEWSAFSCFWDGEAFVHLDKDDGYISYGPKEWLPMPPAPSQR